MMVKVTLISWDNGLHMHPDERQIIMVADKLTWQDLNPHFFAYGTLPIYILKGTGVILQTLYQKTLANYDGLLYVGRTLSVVFDTLTCLFIMLTVAKQVNKRLAIIAGLLWMGCVFSLQNSHFYIVDGLFTALFAAITYCISCYITKPRQSLLVTTSILCGLLISTKFTGVIFVALLLTIYAITHTKKDLLQSLKISTLLLLVTIITAALTMPYAILDYLQFIKDVLQQIQMNSNPYIFPFTLQYVATPAYIYPLYNIIFWGLGMSLSLLSLVGIYHIFVQHKPKPFFIIIGLIALCYFLIIGQSSVKFMRYIYVLYPFLVILAAIGFSYVYSYKKLVAYTFIGVHIIYTLMFYTLYQSPNTRIQANTWFKQNVPIGSVVGSEHWDDRLPMHSDNEYNFIDLPLYDRPDDEYKWSMIKNKLEQLDYIVLASNRLYTPLQKLNDCSKTPKACYPITSVYYQNLLSGQPVAEGLQFVKVAEFTSYPRLQIFGKTVFELNDDNADESFTVYDHPKIIVFKKIVKS
jgi:hypothetical protein